MDGWETRGAPALPACSRFVCLYDPWSAGILPAGVRRSDAKIDMRMARADGGGIQVEFGMRRYTVRFDEALVFASEIHRSQFRKGSGVPYITHLLSVAALVGEFGGTESQVIGALLHDAIEDCVQTTPDIAEQIRSRFGEDVHGIVVACSDTVIYPKPPWRERKETYLETLRHKSPDHPALIVSAADKLHNARSIVVDYQDMGDEIFERFRGKREGTLWYYQSLVTIFTDKLGEHPLVREFVFTVSRFPQA